QIVELRRRLEEQLSAEPSEPKPVSLENLPSSDEIVLAQRARLAELQTQLEEKLRVAEMEMSRERAQLGRLRAELEQQRRELEDQRSGWEKTTMADGAPGPIAKKPTRGRWLTRLGLKESDDEKEK